MQCSACRAVYSNGLDACPRCKTPVASSSSSSRDEPLNKPSPEENAALTKAQVTEENGTPPAAATPTAPPSSTLIEFPGAGRAARPQWRKELSERVRAIQERRAREAEDSARRRLEQPALEAAPQLGLVPPPDAPPVNPIVAAALKRIERARQPMPRGRASMSGAAVAVAHVAEDEYHQDAQPELVTRPVAAPLPRPDKASSLKAAELPRERNLAVVTAAPPTLKTETLPASAAPKRAVATVVDDEALTPLDDEELDAALLEELYDDRAPMVARFASGFIDLLVVAFASSPFAAIIELTNGNWMDPRVSASMGGIIVIVMFLYLAASTAMTGRTWGMSLVSLRAVDADTGLLPTTRQATLRALVYMISLATFGLGILYALFDAEGRAAHDHLSSTAVVRE
jgi:uncharacterized RDD family membrane protein YckC